MAKIPHEKNRTQEKDPNNSWWYVEGLIAGIDAGPPRKSPTRKYLLALVWRHTNRRKGFAWCSQKTLAREMGVPLRTVERIFQWAKQIDIIKVRPVRTGENPEDQHNEFWLHIKRLEELQRPDGHPSPMTDDRTAHPSPMTGDVSGEHPSRETPNTRHEEREHPSQRVRTPVTTGGEGFEVNQLMSNSVNQRGAVYEKRSPNGSPPAGIPKGPGTSFLQEQIDKVTFWAYADLAAHMQNPDIADMKKIRANFQRDCNAIGLDFPTINRIWQEQIARVQNEIDEDAKAAAKTDGDVIELLPDTPTPKTPPPPPPQFEPQKYHHPIFESRLLDHALGLAVGFAKTFNIDEDLLREALALTDCRMPTRQMVERAAAAHRTGEDFIQAFTGEYNEVRQRREERKQLSQPSLPAWIPVPQWDAYLNIRKKYKKPFTEEALIRKLSELRDSGNDPAMVLQQSIDHKWSALYRVLATHEGLKMP